MLNMFQISKYGFLREEFSEDLPDHYEYLDDLIDYYYTHNISEFREYVKSFTDFDKDYDISKLQLVEIQNVYSASSILAHIYVRSEEPYDKNVPLSIGSPWHKSGEFLDIPLVLTHAAINLYNWYLLDESKPPTLNNMSPINVFNKDEKINESEVSFYLPLMAIEAECGSMVHNMETIYSCVEQKNVLGNEDIIANMSEIKSKLKRQIQIMYTIPNYSHPAHFYHHIRPFLHGSSEEVWTLEGLDRKLEYKGSFMAQSSLTQLVDIFFQLGSADDKIKLEIRNYMPGAHRKYLEYISGKTNLKDYLLVDNSEEHMDFRKQVNKKYRECEQLIHTFQKLQLSIFNRYIKFFNNTERASEMDLDTNLRKYMEHNNKVVLYESDISEDSSSDDSSEEEVVVKEKEEYPDLDSYSDMEEKEGIEEMVGYYNMIERELIHFTYLFLVTYIIAIFIGNLYFLYQSYATCGSIGY